MFFLLIYPPRRCSTRWELPASSPSSFSPVSTIAFWPRSTSAILRPNPARCVLCACTSANWSYSGQDHPAPSYCTAQSSQVCNVRMRKCHMVLLRPVLYCAMALWIKMDKGSTTAGSAYSIHGRMVLELFDCTDLHVANKGSISKNN